MFGCRRTEPLVGRVARRMLFPSKVAQVFLIEQLEVVFPQDGNRKVDVVWKHGEGGGPARMNQQRIGVVNVDLATQKRRPRYEGALASRAGD